jgi:hypothetical protein
MKTIDEIEKDLFFIVGCGRSGTTLVKTILNAHNKINIPHETFFFTAIADSFGEGNESLEEKVDLVFSKWWINDMDIDASSVLNKLENKKNRWSNVFLSLIGVLSSDPGLTCYGEKTPAHIKYSKQLLSIYPSCKIIQMVRDPRATFASYLSSKVGTNQIAPFAKEWSYAIETQQLLLSNSRFKSVCFEELITNPEKTTQSICQFLGVEYEESMLDFYKRKLAGFSPEQTHHKNTQKPIFTSGLEKWKKQLSASQISLLEYLLCDRMESLGYKTANTDVRFPRTKIWLSNFLDKISKTCIRKPRQLFKARRATARQNNKQEQ